jgi:AcrR family transcriptional regulator
MTAERPGAAIWMRPERSAVGRPAQHSRAEITAVALALADREGLDAVSMRRVAAELGTGAASLYRYLEHRDDLLDLMTDATGAEYAFAPPTGDWLADLVALGEQGRAIMRRHPWLPGLVLTRPVLGPAGLALMQYVLELLAGHRASLEAKLEAFAMFSSITAMFVQHELAGGSAVQEKHLAYLGHALGAGQFPRLAQLLAAAPPDSGPAGPAPAGPAPAGPAPADRGPAGHGPAGPAPAGHGPADRGPAAPAPAPAPPQPSDPADRYADIMARILTGLLGPQ